MRILMTTPYFSPSLGGMETVAESLASEFVAMGHEVVVATSTQEDDGAVRPFRILRAPSTLSLVRESLRADAVLQSQISLRLGLPSLLLRRPTVISHHMWTPREGPGALLGRVKHALLHLADNVAVSKAMANSLAVPCTVIPNPCQTPMSNAMAVSKHQRELVFLGRLIEDKGLGVLLEALAILASRGVHPSLTVIGSGPDESLHRRQSHELGLTDQVEFTGPLRGQALQERLSAHQLLVAPSVWDEPFGVVVLEALACGLVPVVSDSGGLPEAVGKCGPIVPRGNPDALAESISELLSSKELRQRFASSSAEHLAAHGPRKIAEDYLAALKRSRERR